MPPSPLAATDAAGELGFLGVLVGVAVLLVIAQRGRVPYPIVLVVGGALVAFVPGTPRIELAPEIVLIVFLPPLLYGAAFFSSLRDLRANAGPISLLAVGLVLATMAGVAVVAKLVVDGLDWGPAFVLGAVLSPTDPVAATAIARRLGAPRRVVTIIEGESLVNDSSALIAFKFAVAAVLTGAFSLPAALLDFVVGVAGGLAIGALVSVATVWVRRRVDDTPTEIALSLLTPYVAYLPAEALDVSAVVAAVTTGVWLGWKAPVLVGPAYRLQAYAVWDLLTFMANAALFLLVGLQLPVVLEGLDGVAPARLVLEAVAVAGTVVAVRIAWNFGFNALHRAIPGVPRAGGACVARPDGLADGDGNRRSRPGEFGDVGRDRPGAGSAGARSLFTPGGRPAKGETLLIAWTGMRGAVSLAAALAVPLSLADGTPFPGRDRILFLTYTTIMATLLLQGLSLPALIRRQGIGEDDTAEQDEERLARRETAVAALRSFDEVVERHGPHPEVAQRVRDQYRYRRNRWGDDHDEERLTYFNERNDSFVGFRVGLLEAEREALFGLRAAGRISEDVAFRVLRDIDLEQERVGG